MHHSSSPSSSKKHSCTPQKSITPKRIRTLYPMKHSPASFSANDNTTSSNPEDYYTTIVNEKTTTCTQYTTEQNSEKGVAIVLLRKVNDVEASFLIENSLHNLMEMSSLGEIQVSEKFSQSVTKYEGVLSDHVCILAGKTFDSIQLNKRKTIHHSGHSLFGGMCISDQLTVLCTLNSPYKLVVTDISTGTITTECTLLISSKRLACDTENQTFYISLFSNYFYSVKFVQSFGKQTQLKYTSPFNGGICIHNNILYMVVGKEIMKMDLNQGSRLQTAFPTNTDCIDLNGLAVDHNKDRLIHTT
ncbi:unnamed protein product [Mytilus edulis]|uniref:Uncharacterized protein n=1 Tax=Mytilus edulis TaxID=6550 RepID=A0A8S3V4U4_MYTED|nr:unnamed protein product [Mytilus edulis]